MSQYPLAAGAKIGAVDVAPPQICEQESAYIRITRSTGTRRLGTARLPDGGFHEGCQKFPENAADSSQCPVIDHKVLLHDAFKQLQLQGVALNGNGMGPCGDIRGDYDASNMSIGVVSWKDAQKAVNLLASMLNDYDLQGHVGLAVRGYDCVEIKPVGEGAKPAPPPPLCETLPAPSSPSNSPALDSLAPNTGWVRLRYQSQPDQEAKVIEAVSKDLRVYRVESDTKGINGWSLRVVVESPQLPHPSNFYFSFHNPSKRGSLALGHHPTYQFGVDIAAIEHGYECRVDPSATPAQGLMHIIQSDQTSATGSWTGNTKLMPVLHGSDPQAATQNYWLESVVFNKIRVE